jgi:hypothetical protein
MNQERIREIYGGCNAENLFGGYNIGGMAEYEEESEDEYELEGGVYKKLTKKQKDANKAKRAATKRKAPANRKAPARRKATGKKSTTYKPSTKMLEYIDEKGNTIKVNPKDLNSFIEKHPDLNIRPNAPRTRYEKFAEAKAMAEMTGRNPAREAEEILRAYRDRPTTSTFSDQIVRTAPISGRFNEFLKAMVRIGLSRNLDSAYGAIRGLKPIYDEMESFYIVGKSPLYDPTDIYAVDNFITDEMADDLFTNGWTQGMSKRIDVVNLAKKQQMISRNQKKSLGWNPEYEKTNLDTVV